MRVDEEQADLLWDILYDARGDLIGRKIKAREQGEDTTSLRHALTLIKQMMDECARAREELQ